MPAPLLPSTATIIAAIDRRSSPRPAYIQEQEKMLERDVLLVEIDLLRGGTHTTAVPLHRLRRKAPAFDDHVCVYRFDEFEDYYGYPLKLQEALPTIDVPLLPGDAAVPLDLQTVLDRCYDMGPYRREIDYSTAEMIPPLRAELVECVQQRVQAE